MWRSTTAPVQAWTSLHATPRGWRCCRLITQKAALCSTDRRRFVGVLLQGPDARPGPAGGDLVTRASTQIVADAQAEWDRGRLARVEAFPTVEPGAVVLEFEEVTITPTALRGCPAPAGRRSARRPACRCG
jgi:hypothetical protein